MIGQDARCAIITTELCIYDNEMGTGGEKKGEKRKKKSDEQMYCQEVFPINSRR